MTLLYIYFNGSLTFCRPAHNGSITKSTNLAFGNSLKLTFNLQAVDLKINRKNDT